MHPGGRLGGLIAGLVVAGLVIAVRMSGGFQSLELAAYDQARLVSPAYTFRTRVAGERARAMREARERAGATCP